MKRIIFSLLIILLAGCGTEMTIRIEEDLVEPPPSDQQSAGGTSGSTYSTGGESYKAVLSVGSPMPGKIQTSENGRYQVK